MDKERPAPILRFDDVRRILPQGRPFLMVDEVLELDRGRRILCARNLTGNEAVFEGHFPGFAVLPGVLMIEAMAQSAILLFVLSEGDPEGGGGAVPASAMPGKGAPGGAADDRVFLLVGVKSRLKSPARPGDRLLVSVEADKILSAAALVRAKVLVEDREVAEGELSFAVRRAGELK